MTITPLQFNLINKNVKTGQSETADGYNGQDYDDLHNQKLPDSTSFSYSKIAEINSSSTSTLYIITQDISHTISPTATT